MEIASKEGRREKEKNKKVKVAGGNKHLMNAISVGEVKQTAQ